MSGMPKSLLKDKPFLIAFDKTRLENRDLIQPQDLREEYSQENDEETHAS